MVQKSLKILVLLCISIASFASNGDTNAQPASGPAAYYAPGWDAATIFYRHHSWGNTIPDATHPPYNGHFCVHPDYRPGTVLSITAPIGNTTCLVFDSVAPHDQWLWRSRWALEVDWNTFHALGLNHTNWVTVHGPVGAQSVATQVVEHDPCEHFDATDQSVCNGFLEFWLDNGGTQIFGYPLTGEFDDPENGLVLQYFERAVFEWHDDHVKLRRVGAKLIDIELR